ncbi:hypothetical protein [Nostoc sp.]|uniref:hypothetical protein n=1 Tax=Nostoc sp. TaxID=1180 RepID=UPI002FF6147B
MIQTEHYGHNLSKVHPTDHKIMTGVPSQTTVQTKMNIQSAMASQSFEGQTTNDSLNSKPMQLVYHKEERLKAKEFNQKKKQEIQSRLRLRDERRGAIPLLR